MKHPTFEKLVDYAEGILAENDAVEIEAHLAEPCPTCAQQISRIQKIIQTAAKDRTAAPGSAVLLKATRLPKDREKVSRQTIIQKIASLVFDNRRQMAAISLRGRPLAQRMLLYTAPPLDIDLQITPQADHLKILGQVLNSSKKEKFITAFVSIVEMKSGNLVNAAETDRLGKFHFENIPAGLYDLVFDLMDGEVKVTNLDLAMD